MLYPPAGIPHLKGHQAPIVSITPISADEGGGARTGALLDHSEEDGVGLSFQLASLDRCERGVAEGCGQRGSTAAGLGERTNLEQDTTPAILILALLSPNFVPAKIIART